MGLAEWCSLERKQSVFEQGTLNLPVLWHWNPYFNSGGNGISTEKKKNTWLAEPCACVPAVMQDTASLCLKFFCLLNLLKTEWPMQMRLI
jgi:hypothetical protein